jgi:hypothetical protein
MNHTPPPNRPQNRPGAGNPRNPGPPRNPGNPRNTRPAPQNRGNRPPDPSFNHAGPRNRQVPPQQRPYGAPQGQRTQDPEYQAYLRRRQEIERRQAEARRQAMRDRERREKMRRKEERNRRIKRGLQILGGRLLVFAVILLILCAVTGILFLLFFNHAPDEADTSGNITYYYGGSETRKIPFEEAVIDDVVYICFNDLAAYLGMMESGTAEAMKFILPMSDEIPATSGGTGTEESITFHTGEVNVSINGQSAQLRIPNILRGTEVWVSSSIITDYMLNLSFEYNARKSDILISRLLDEENSNEEEQKFVYLPVSFKLKNSDALAPLDEEDALGALD